MRDFIHVKPSLAMNFDPKPWNDPRLARLRNCFTYGLNSPALGKSWENTAPFAEGVPPEIAYAKRDRLLKSLDARIESSGPNPTRRLTAKEIEGVRFRIAGFRGISKEQINLGYHHVIAFDKDNQHFYRRDADGTWSHKNGETDAINTDFDGKIIHDLERANLGGFRLLVNQRLDSVKKLMLRQQELSSKLDDLFRAAKASGDVVIDVNRGSFADLACRVRSIRNDIAMYVNIPPAEFNYVVVPPEGLWAKPQKLDLF